MLLRPGRIGDPLAPRARVELAALEAQSGELERHVALLRSDNLDPDMLDEEARSALNMIGPNEVVILP